jgi:hypothetical protein
MMVSPRNSWRISIVAGLRVATNPTSRQQGGIHFKTIADTPELSSEVASSTINRLGLQNLSETMGDKETFEIDQQFLWPQDGG